MSTKEQRESLNEVLSDTLSRTIDFVKFAETKNAALLTFASAWLVALTNLLTGDRIVDSGPRFALAIALLLFALAALVALWSFLPKLSLNSLHRDPNREKNLLYFGDIAGFEPSAYAKRVRVRYAANPKEVTSDDYLDDLAVQVSANSSIASRKFYIFSVGATLVIFALAILTAAAAVVTYIHLFPK